MNLASKREDSNRATSPHYLSAVRSDRQVPSAVDSCDHVTVSRGQVVPDSSRWSRGRGQVACNHLASRFIGGSLFLIPGKKNGCVASLSQSSACGFQIHRWVSFFNTRKKRRRGIAITSQRTCSVLLNAHVLHQPSLLHYKVEEKVRSPRIPYMA